MLSTLPSRSSKGYKILDHLLNSSDMRLGIVRGFTCGGVVRQSLGSNLMLYILTTLKVLSISAWFSVLSTRKAIGNDGTWTAVGLIIITLPKTLIKTCAELQDSETRILGPIGNSTSLLLSLCFESTNSSRSISHSVLGSCLYCTRSRPWSCYRSLARSCVTFFRWGVYILPVSHGFWCILFCLVCSVGCELSLLIRCEGVHSSAIWSMATWIGKGWRWWGSSPSFLPSKLTSSYAQILDLNRQRGQN